MNRLDNYLQQASKDMWDIDNVEEFYDLYLEDLTDESADKIETMYKLWHVTHYAYMAGYEDCFNNILESHKWDGK